jgi:hypothetical protein
MESLALIPLVKEKIAENLTVIDICGIILDVCNKILKSNCIIEINTNRPKFQVGALVDLWLECIRNLRAGGILL